MGEDENGRLVGEARFHISDKKIKLEDEEGYYTFWVAFINSENEEDERSIRSMYGYTELLPGQITADTLISSDGNFVIDMLSSYLEIFNKDKESMIKLNGKDGSGYFAKKNLSWNSQGNLFITGQFQTNTESEKIGIRINSIDKGSTIGFYSNWWTSDEVLGSKLSQDEKNKTFLIWNPIKNELVPLSIFYKLGTLNLTGLGGCEITGNSATFGSTKDNDSYISINWENMTSPGGLGTSPVPGELDIKMRGLKQTDDPTGLSQYKLYVTEDGTLKLNL